MTPFSPGAVGNHKREFPIQSKEYYQLAITALWLNFSSSDIATGWGISE